MTHRSVVTAMLMSGLLLGCASSAPPPAAHAGAPASLTVLNGELGNQPVVVEITRTSCRNAEGVDTLASVQVTMEGQPQRRGCGFLAVY